MRRFMDNVEEEKIAYSLLTILQSYAPNGDAQAKCTDYYNLIYKEDYSNLNIRLVNALHDGLTYGNWLWL